MKMSIQTSTAMPYDDELNGIILEISGFSTLAMFGHLFDLPRGVEMGLIKVERNCCQILHHQLTQWLSPLHLNSEKTDLRPDYSELEQSLATIFNTHSPFWERYYARQHAKEEYQQPPESLSILTNPGSSFQLRDPFPQFFTVLDALAYSTFQNRSTHTLIETSMQEYLKASFLSIHNKGEARKSYRKALQLVGPLNAPAYRNLLENKLKLGIVDEG